MTVCHRTRTRLGAVRPGSRGGEGSSIGSAAWKPTLHGEIDEENKGELHRIGFEAKATINRHEFGVSWQDELPAGGVVVSNEIELNFDVEAIQLEDHERTGAIEY
jgi:YceI-like domain